MKTLIEDIEIIKKRIAHLRKLAMKGGGQDAEELLQEINLIKNSIASLQEKDISIEGQIEQNTEAISENFDKIDSCQLLTSNLYSKFNVLDTENETRDSNITDLQGRTSALESLVANLGGGDDVLSAYAGFTKGNNNTGTGYMEFKVSSNKILRVFYGITRSNSALTYDKPFDEVLWALSVPCHISQTTATHYGTIATFDKTMMTFVGGSIYCRFEVWGLINV